MSYLVVRRIVTLTIILVLLNACSGGESGTGNNPSDDTTVVGPVTGFGSVYVNGIKFNTTSTSVSIDGVLANENQLAIGMVVRVKGSVDKSTATGSATSINALYEVKGLVTSVSSEIVSSGLGTIEVMGQSVTIKKDTVFKSSVTEISSVNELVAGQSVVVVSGFVSGVSEITATFISVKSNNSDVDEIKVKGFVGNLNTEAGRFTIGNLTVNYSLATTEFEDMDINDLADGLFVEVESDSGFDLNENSIDASEIKRANAEDDDDVGVNLHVEGVVTQQLSGDTFVLSGRSIQINSQTEYNPAEIVLGAQLEVEGSMQSGGIILAKEIEARNESDDEVSGLVEAKDTLNNSITIGGNVFFVTAITRYEDENNRLFSFDSIEVGVTVVEVKYYIDEINGNFIATSIEAES